MPKPVNQDESISRVKEVSNEELLDLNNDGTSTKTIDDSHDTDTKISEKRQRRISLIFKILLSHVNIQYRNHLKVQDL